MKWFPNFLTSMNVLMGSIAIVLAFQSDGYLIYSALFIGIGAGFDFFDGFAARLLKVSSEMGKELDSLADMVSFGLAPAVLMYKLIGISLFGVNGTPEFSELSAQELIFMFSAFILAVFSALRLAKFNIDTRQTSSFIGMPTPAGAIAIISLVIIFHFFTESFIYELTSSSFFLIAYAVVISLLLVSELPMFSLKIKSLKFNENYIQYIFILSIAALFIAFQGIAIVFIIPLYILLSIINNFINRSKKI